MEVQEKEQKIRGRVVEFLQDSVNVKLLNLYDKGNRFAGPKSKGVSKVICGVLSPTWWIASVSNESLNAEDRTKSLISRNYFYLTSSIVILALAGFFLPSGSAGRFDSYLVVPASIMLYMFTWSRCNEILFAFISDALDKTEGRPPRSKLTYRKRIELAFISYIELILNYAILYYFMPISWFDLGVSNMGVLAEGVESASYLNDIFDAIYFSGVTITTLGYGDFSPQAALPKIMVVHQVLVGFTLIVVSFAIYAGKGLSHDSSDSSQ